MEFIPTSGSIDLGTNNTQQEEFYFINFSKMNSVNDLIIVLQAMGFGLSSHHPLFEQVKPFLDLDKGVVLPKQGQPQKQDLKLPDINKL